MTKKEICDKRKEINTKSHFWAGIRFGCGIMCAIVFLAITIGLFLHEFSFIDRYLLNTISLTPKSASHVNELLKTNSIVSANEIISHIHSFYSIVITLLIGIVGLVAGLLGFVGYVQFKRITDKATEEAKKEAANDVQTYLNTHEFHTKISARVDEVFNENFVIERLNTLENQIEVFQNLHGKEILTELPKKAAKKVAVKKVVAKKVNKSTSVKKASKTKRGK